jgi:uncharacterized RmlC-like cupin family protein
MRSAGLRRGAVLSKNEFQYVSESGRQVARPVHRDLGLNNVEVDVVRIPEGQRWAPEHSAQYESVVVVFSGSGKGEVGREVREIAADALLGTSFAVEASAGGMEIYVWRTWLLEGRGSGAHPRKFANLWDEEAQLRGFTGIRQTLRNNPATMTFLFWPGTGSAPLCLHSGFMEPGQTFSVHIHEHWEEAFMAFSGVGQLLTFTRWQLAVGSLILRPITLAAEGLSSHISAANMAGFGPPPIAFVLLLTHRAIMCAPSVLVPEMASTAPLVPGMEGQYIIKTLAIIALGIGLAAQIRPAREKTHRFDNILEQP